MKKLSIRLIPIICLFLSLGLASGFFQSSVPDQAAEIVRQQYLQDLQQFQQAVSTLHAFTHKGNFQQAELQQKVKDCRESFKRCE